MASFQRVALVQSHQRLAPTHAYYLPDLVELCGLAAVIRERVEEVRLPVSPSDREPLATFEQFVRRRRPELVGISSFTCGAGSAREYARIASAHGAFVVAGGFHPSARPEEVLGWDGVDAVVRGEGEEALAALVEKGTPEGIPGLSYRSSGGFVHHPVPPVIADLDALPLPARELRPERFGLTGLDYHTDTVYASRGCRGRCRFCANHLVGRSWRPRSNELIMQELETITPPRKGPWKYVKFWDSNFLADPDRIEGLCQLILDAGLERWFRFIVETRVEDIIRAAPILATMRRAGFVRMGCGVESPSRATHLELGKGINLELVDRAAKLVSAAEIQFTKFLIIGHPRESRQDILAYPEYALSHGAHLQKSTVFVMTPYPGTELAEEYAARGWVTSADWALYTNFGAVVAPNGIPSLDLQGLLLAVSAAIGMGTRFAAARRFPQVVARVFEPLFVMVAMARLNDRHDAGTVAEAVMAALAEIPADRRRPPRGSGRVRSGDRLALRFHLHGRPSVVIGIVADGEGEHLVTRTGSDRLHRGGRPLREIHLSVPLLVDLIDGLDHRLVTHDAAILRWRRGRFRLRWVPSLARQLVIAGLALARLTWFHLVRSARRSRWARSPSSGRPAR